MKHTASEHPLLLIALGGLTGFVLGLALLPSIKDTRVIPTTTPPAGPQKTDTPAPNRKKQIPLDNEVPVREVPVREVPVKSEEAAKQAVKLLKKIDSMCHSMLSGRTMDYDAISNKILEVKVEFDTLYPKIPEGSEKQELVKTTLKQIMENYLRVREDWVAFVKANHEWPAGYEGDLKYTLADILLRNGRILNWELKPLIK